MSDESVCCSCSEPRENATLSKCPVCFRRFCEEHAHAMSGRQFCSKRCAQYFFFGDPDD